MDVNNFLSIRGMQVYAGVESLAAFTHGRMYE